MSEGKKNGVIPANPKEDETLQDCMKGKASYLLDCAKEIVRILP